MIEVDIKNKVHPRNIILFCALGILGLLNGGLDFGIYKEFITKLVLPDPVVYTKIIEMNQTAMDNVNVINNAGTAFNFAALGVFVLAAVLMIGLTAGVMGKCD